MKMSISGEIMTADTFRFPLGLGEASKEDVLDWKWTREWTRVRTLWEFKICSKVVVAVILKN